MTGYGRAWAVAGGRRVTVELSSVNRRQAEVAVNLPRELEPLEPRIRDVVARRVSRGRVMVRLSLQLAELAAGSGRLNHALARAYAKELRQLARELKLSGDLSIGDLIRAPGIFQAVELTDDSEAWWPVVQSALEKGLESLTLMRSREGKHLATELKRRVSQIRVGVKRIRRLAGGVVERYRVQLLERIRQAGVEVAAPDDDRVIKELVFFADRSDITEELTRLESHFGQFDDCLKSADAVGRTLDFLAQEMNRELNTIGSKANDGGISREIVFLKTELEKFREQVQNVE